MSGSAGLAAAKRRRGVAANVGNVPTSWFKSQQS